MLAEILYLLCQKIYEVDANTLIIIIITDCGIIF